MSTREAEKPLWVTLPLHAVCRSSHSGCSAAVMSAELPPSEMLAEGTRAVARVAPGKAPSTRSTQSRDELGVLTGSFNQQLSSWKKPMTAQRNQQSSAGRLHPCPCCSVLVLAENAMLPTSLAPSDVLILVWKG